ncbi:MAG TPA: carbohydrate-binding protein, partial [Flavisolibacter sp.]|nr:carbohydrate-binding protein [Flavisolibacter sp.]
MKYKIAVTGRFFLFQFLIVLFITTSVAAQSTANSFSSYIPYSGKYRYGANPGYYGSNWSAQDVATLAMGNTSLNVKGVGVKSLRVPLYDDHLTYYGFNVEVPKLQHYINLGGGDITAFVGNPHPTRRETITFPGSPEQAKTFKGLYEPVWLDAAQTQINPANTYAKYLYDVVKVYGQYVKFWEIVNEPDYTYSASGWLGDANPPSPGSWFDHNPTADELENLRAPIFYYIRTLRVSWEVIKKLQPNSYVCTGGIGYRSFLDAILRNTDNPSDGSINSNYPLKGGAYFDIMSFHNYPMYSLKAWSNTIGGFELFRHSDAAVKAYIKCKDNMEALLQTYGYNGATYPKKQFICTETGVSRIMDGETWGSNEGQKNYMVKAQVASQRSGIKQVYWYTVGDQANAYAQYDQMGMYKYFGSSFPYNATPTDQGIALKTTSDILYDKTYDATRTSALNLPSSVDGGAFRGSDGKYVYVLWAKTTTDLSENASATYSFPSVIMLSGKTERKEWNYSKTNTSLTIDQTNISLTGSPSFFIEASGITTSPTPTSPTNSSRIEAESYTSMSGVQTETTSDEGGGKNVGWIDNGDWMNYSVSVSTSGTFAVNLRVATIYSGSQLQIKKSDGTVLATVNVPTTGGFQTFQTISTNIALAAGSQTIKIQSTSSAGWNFNWFEIAGGSSSTTSPTTSTSSKTEAENYSSMSGVQTETTTDAGGGKNVGWIESGDWMNYSVSVSTAASYTINFRIATPNSGSQFQVKKADGTLLATVNIPVTGGFQSWQTISATVPLSAGSQTIKLQASGSPFNINWFE